MPSSGRQETQEKCPTGLCLESKPTCTRNGGKVIQVKPRDEDSKDLTMRCCGVQKCKMPHTAKKENIAAKAPGIKTPKIYHRKCAKMKMIHISKCKPSGGGTDEDEDADEDDPIPLRHNTVSDDECPKELCLESKPTCTRSGGKVVQVKPR